MARISVASQVMLVALLVGMLQPSALGELQPAGDGAPQATSVGQRRPFLTQRRRQGPPHAVPRQRFKVAEQQFEPVPLFVMLQLDTVDPGSFRLKEPEILREQLAELKRAGVAGVMCDVWWGIVEREGPGIYDWSAYIDLVEMVAAAGLKLQAVMSFHQCGGNVGDECFIRLPWWVLKVGETNPDIFYTDARLFRNTEYLSLGADEEKLFGIDEENLRSPLDMYEDFMASFAKTFKSHMGDVITEAQVGMGPAGELRYPSYPLAFWQWPGIGEFQCYDKFLRKNLIAAAAKAKKPEYGLMFPPHTDIVGNYNHSSEQTSFFKDGGLWNTTEGDFFLSWYSDQLIKHGDRVLARARKAFKGSGIHLAAKVAGIHWHFNSSSHAPELTAGYYNTCLRNGYEKIAKMFGSHHALFDFTCLEMRNRELPTWASSRPEELVELTMRAAEKTKTLYAGENALPRFDRCAYEQMLSQCTRQALKDDGTVSKSNAKGTSIAGFTYLRLGKQIMDLGEHWWEFTRFAHELRSGFHFPRWSAVPEAKQARRDHVKEHLQIEVDETVAELMLRLGGVRVYDAKGHSKDKVPVPDTYASESRKAFFKVPRVQSGIQAGVRAGQNGKPLKNSCTIRFHVAENLTDEELQELQATRAYCEQQQVHTSPETQVREHIL